MNRGHARMFRVWSLVPNRPNVGSHYGVMFKVLDSGIEVSDFVFNSLNYLLLV